MTSSNPYEWVVDPNESGALVTLGCYDLRRKSFINTLYSHYFHHASRPAGLLIESNWGVRRFLDTLPEDRIGDLVICDLTDRTVVTPANPLATISGPVSQRVNVLTRTVRSMWGDSWKPIYEEAYRCALGALAVTNDGRGKLGQLGLFSLPYLLRATPDWIENYLEKAINKPDHNWIASYFRHRFVPMPVMEKADIVEPVVERSDIFGWEIALPMLSATRPFLALESLFDARKIVVILTDAGGMNEADRFFVHWALSAAHSYLAERQSKHSFLLAVDCFEYFSGYEWEAMLEYSSRPGVRVILAPRNDENVSIDLGRKICRSVRANIIFSPDEVRTPWIRSAFSNLMFNILSDAVVANFAGDQTPYALSIPPAAAETPDANARRKRIMDSRLAYSCSTVDMQAEVIAAQSSFAQMHQKTSGAQKLRRGFGSLFGS